MKNSWRILFALSVIYINSNAALPDNATLSGKITDKQTGESIPGVSVYIPDLKSGAMTDIDGKYIINNLPNRKITISISLIGYKTILESIDLTQTKTKDFILDGAVKEINEVVITGSSDVVERNKTATPISIINKSALVENASSNIIDALSTQPGITQVSTGNGISKPVIRGLGYNRVVVMNDGVRQEGQQWGDEHGIEIDENVVDKIEILKGPASLTYGSDAMAGVINFLTAPPLPEGQYAGNLNFNYQTNDGLFGYSLNAKGNRKGFIFDLRYSAKQAHDYQNKYDGYVFNSRFKEEALSTIIGLNRSWGYVHLNLSAFNLNPGIVEGERDSTTGKFIKPVVVADSISEEIVSESDSKKYSTYVPYQDVDHYKAVLNSSMIIKNGTLKSIVGFQQNNRKEFADAMSPDEYGLYFLLNTINYDFRYIFPEKKGYNISAGINGMYQQSLNKGTEFLVPAYDLFDIGYFGMIRKNLGKFDLSSGLRFDTRSENIEVLWLDSTGMRTFENNPGGYKLFNASQLSFSGISGSIGTTYQFSKKTYGKINASTGFRSPNIAELGANGIHEGTFRYEIGNTELKQERSIQGDLAFGINTEHVSVELDLFDNRINDYIFLSALHSTNGGDSITDGLNTFKYISGDAELAGGEILIDIHPHPLDWLHFENSFSYVSAQLKNQPDSTKYLPNTPPGKLITDIKLTRKKLLKAFTNAYFKIGFDTYFSQDKIYSAYNTETSTPGYTPVNVGMGSDILIKKKSFISIHLNASNLGDIAYQNHLSRLKYAPINYATRRTGVYNEGRSFSIKLGLNF